MRATKKINLAFLCKNKSIFLLLDILALADSIRLLSVASRHIRTSMWSALQATILFVLDPALAAGDKAVADDKCLRPTDDEEGKKEEELKEGGTDRAEEKGACQQQVVATEEKNRQQD